MVSRYGEAATKDLWSQAAVLYEELCETYKDDCAMVKLHTEKSIFVGVAVYKTLMKEHAPDAMDSMQVGMKTGALRAVRIISKGMRIPGASHLFIFLFPILCKKLFGPASLFEQKMYETQKNVAKMDIYQCPYCMYCSKLGCPELTHLFCDNDEYTYGNLPGIRFTRHQTLSRGGDRCDFQVERVQK